MRQNNILRQTLRTTPEAELNPKADMEFDPEADPVANNFRH